MSGCCNHTEHAVIHSVSTHKDTYLPLLQVLDKLYWDGMFELVKHEVAVMKAMHFPDITNLYSQ
jgi:hypothetical protein